MWDDTSLGEWDTLICRVPVSARPILTTSFAAKLRRGSIRTCSAACFRRAHARCVCVPSPSTGSGPRKCGSATGRGRRCTDATRGFSGRLWDWAFSNPAVSAPDNRQDSAPPSNSAQATPVDATTTATAPTTTAATELAPQPVTASEKSQKSGAQPEAARPRLVRRLCVAPAFGLRPRARLRPRLCTTLATRCEDQSASSERLYDHCNFRDGSKQSLDRLVD